MPSSRGSSQPRDWTQVSCLAGGFFTIWATGKSKNTGVGNLSLLQRIFPTQELNQVSCIAGRFLSSWAIRKAHVMFYYIGNTKQWLSRFNHIMCACMLSHFSFVWPFATSWTVAHLATLFMGFSRQEYWCGLPCPPPGDLPNPGTEHCFIHLLHWQQAGSLPLEPCRKLQLHHSHLESLLKCRFLGPTLQRF